MDRIKTSESPSLMRRQNLEVARVKIRSQKGVIVFELPALVIIFILFLIFYHNTLITLHQVEITNALEASALAGASVLKKQPKNAPDFSQVVDMCEDMMREQKVLGRIVDRQRLQLQIGRLTPNGKRFKTGARRANAVRLTYSIPSDDQKSLYSRAENMVQKIPFLFPYQTSFTAVAAFDEDNVYLAFPSNR